MNFQSFLSTMVMAFVMTTTAWLLVSCNEEREVSIPPPADAVKDTGRAIEDAIDEARGESTAEKIGKSIKRTAEDIGDAIEPDTPVEEAADAIENVGDAANKK